MNKAILLVAFCFIFSSCDKVETPYKEGGSTTTETTDKTRNILIEDYTGHTCGNCPSAALIAENLKDTYGDQIIIMGVHAGWFARPKSGPKYTTDFSNTDSEIYDQTFGNSTAGNPNGLINRVKQSGSIIIQPANWETALLSIKDLEADLALSLSSSYNSSTNEISIEVKTSFFNTLSGDFSLVLAYVEDSIVDWQKDYTLPAGEQDIEQYTHKHVFRGNINGTWGDNLSSETTTENVKETFNFAYTPDASWNVNNSYIVAYVYDKDTYEILQVEETHVSEE